MINDVYAELVIDIVMHCNTNAFTARKIVDFLKKEGHIDYDALKEYYAEKDNDEV